MESASNHSGNSTKPCESGGPYERAFYYILSLSIFITALLSLLQKRKRLWPGRFDGRPGIIYPVNLLDDRRNRLAYAAAFVLISMTPVSELINGETDFGSNGPFTGVFLRILSVLVYCLYFYPLFAAVTLESMLTHAIGMLYSYTLLGLYIAELFSCNSNKQVLTFNFFLEIPLLICLMYLSVLFPYKFFKGIIKTLRRRKLDIGLQEQAYDAYQIQHLRMLLLSAKRLKEINMTDNTGESMGRCGKLKNIIHQFYRPRPGFKYSTRLVSTIVVSLFAVYTALIAFIHLLVPLKPIASSVGGNEYFWNTLEVCWKVSLGASFSLFLLTIPLILQGYRENLLSVFKGDHSVIPRVAENTNFSITPAMRVVSASRYAGFQVAYAVFGFIMHFIVLLCVTGSFSLAIVTHKGRGILMAIVRWAWPFVVIGIVLTLIQYLLARFVFLQDRGRVFALDNRRLFHNCTFFAFLYNIYLGLFSSLMRLFKGMFFGALLFPRLDYSILPRVVERFDPGFRAYVGFLQLENAHTHPVLVCFCRLLLLSRQVDDDELEDDTEGDGSINTIAENAQAVSKTDRYDKHRSLPSTTVWYDRRRRLPRNRWFLAFTLICNPGLQQLRHSRDRRPRPRDEDFDIDQIVIEGIGSTA